MKYRVSFRPRAEADLIGLFEYIAEVSGRDVADEYIGRIETACVSLATFPKRGKRHDDISPGLRTIGFERRVTVAFCVSKEEVVIVRIFYGGRDYETLLRVMGGD
jgi:toxin ParE1/3/4